MSLQQGRLAGPVGGVHPAVLSRRMHDLLLLGLAALIPLVLGLAISLEDPNPSIPLVLAIVFGMLGVVALVVNKRLDVGVMCVALYLGLLEGPVKLGTGGHELASVMRDVVIFAVCLGALLRLRASRQPITLPPLSGWVLAWGALVLVEGLNPKTHGILKALGGYRQQLEWVPFFFFGYALMRSRRRFRQFFMVLAVIALANGVVGTYQSQLSPSSLASWGPGYKELVYGTKTTNASKTGISGRVFGVEGEARVRPPALSTDAGFGGGMGGLALPATLALLASVGLRRRWPILLCVFAELAGIATGEGRQQVVAAVLGVLTFAALSLSTGRRATRTIAVMLGVILLTIPVGALFVTALGSRTFSRYESIEPENLSPSTKDNKLPTLALIPKDIEQAPFGVGLGEVGAATGFGGVVEHVGLEEHGVSAETQYNYVVDELGLPGLLLWVGFSIRLIALGLTGLRRIPDLEVRLYLAAMLGSLIGMTFVGVSGPTQSSPAWGCFFWFTAGTFAYWFISMRRRSFAKPRPVLQQ